MGVGGDCAKLRELLMVSGVLPEVSSLVLGELLKQGPRHLERRRAHQCDWELVKVIEKQRGTDTILFERTMNDNSTDGIG